MKDKEYYDFLFWNNFKNNFKIKGNIYYCFNKEVTCDKNLFKYTFFDSISDNEIIESINKYYEDNFKISGGYKKYKIIKKILPYHHSN